MVGALAIRAKLAAPGGLVTERPDFEGTTLPSLDGMVFGGHDVAETPLPRRAEQLADAGVIHHHLVTALGDDLTAVEAELRAGVTSDDRRPQAEASEALATDLTQFRYRHGLHRVIVVNVSSTEAPV